MPRRRRGLQTLSTPRMANIPLSSRRHSLPENIFSALKLYVITDVQCALRERSFTQIVLAQIALHVAFSYPGAQFYIGCAQVKIVSIIQSGYRLLVLIRPIVVSQASGGSASPPTISLPGAYQPTDPGKKYSLVHNLCYLMTVNRHHGEHL